ncbi:MAG: hypothetical protein ABIY51_09615, partial [Ferruginibacter sp.]
MEGINCTLKKGVIASWRTRILPHLCKMMVAFVFVLMGMSSVTAQNDFRQAANNTGAGLGVITWINSIVQQNNSKYYEGTSVPQRIIFLNVGATPGNNHSATISHQSIKASNNSHAYDFLTSWNDAYTTAGIYTTGVNLLNTLYSNQCAANPGSDPTGFLTACTAVHGGSGFHRDIAIPLTGMLSPLGDAVDSRIAAYKAQFGASMTVRVWGNADITAGSVVFNGYTGGDMDAGYTINWTSASTSVVIELAGHLAVGVDPFNAAIGYGANKGAGSIGGGPYHFHLETLDGASLGSQDNQLKGSDLFTLPQASCAINGPFFTCASTSSVVFTTVLTDGGVAPDYAYTINAGNTANAQMTGTTSGTYNGPVSVTLIPVSGSFVAGGTVSVTFTASRNGQVLSTCTKQLTINALPIAQGTGLFSCDNGNGQGTFNLTSLNGFVTGNASGVTIDWYSNLALTILITTPGSYNAPNNTNVYAQVTNTTTGCTNVAPVVLTVTPKPTCVITGSGEVCSGLSTQWCAADGMTGYSWTGPGGFTSANQCISVSVAGLYTVTITNGNGCTSTCNRTLVVNALPVCSITGNNAICVGQSTSFLASGGTSYSWTGPGGFTAATASTGTITVAGAYTVLVINANGCTSSCSRTLTVNALPICDITGNNVICAGFSTSFLASGGTSYSWTGPGGFTAATASTGT